MDNLDSLDDKLVTKYERDMVAGIYSGSTDDLVTKYERDMQAEGLCFKANETSPSTGAKE